MKRRNSQQLYVGGDGVAVGYWNNATLSAERFVPNPLGNSSSGRIFRTGDLGRRLSDGNVEYIGRLDEQVKIMGNRVEIAEVERTLSELKGIDEAAVLAWGEAMDTKLCGYCVGDVSEGFVLSELSRRLPRYMIPSKIVFLSSFPYNANGKLDRRALPAPEIFLRKEGNLTFSAFKWPK